METKSYTVYKFDELTKDAQEKAICDFINFELKMTPYESLSEAFKRAINAAEKMQTPWFAPSYAYEYAKGEVAETLRINEYNFTENGDID